MSAKDNAQAHFPVAIVGAGPTGLTLANLLGAYNVRAILIERNPATVGEPRAVSIDDESLRTLQAIGILDTVMAQTVPGYGSEYYTPGGALFLRVKPSERPYGHPRRNAFRQPLLEAQLRDALSRYSSVTSWFDCELQRSSQTPTRVLLDLKHAGGHRQIECDYLIACDGASSAIRTSLDIALQGRTFAERWLILDLENSPAPTPQTRVFCVASRPCISLPGPNSTRRYEFKLLPHESAEEMLKPSTVERLLHSHGAAPGSQLTRKVVYTFHARIAQRWHQGRVFLAGDAAHLSPPFAGQGMNSGVRDAHNLAWKLAAVVEGRLGSALLDSYEQERRGHVEQMIQLALHMGKIMAPASRATGWLMQTALRVLSIWPFMRDYFGQMKYKPKPYFERGFFVRERPDRSKLVGRLLPQPHVRRIDGTVVLLDEVLGIGFALISLDRDAGLLARLPLAGILGSLGPRRIALAPGPGPQQAHASVEVVTEQAAAIAPSLLRYRAGALFVRPDHYVAAIVDLAKPASSLARLERLMASSWRTTTDAES